MSRVPTIPDKTFVASVALRWGDVDALGHVNNVIYLRLLEEARVQFLAGLASTGEHGFGVLAARHEIDYLKPLHYSTQPVAIKTWIERIGTASFTVGYVVVAPDGDIVCAAKTVIVAIDALSGKAVAMPEQLRQRLQVYAIHGDHAG